MASIIEAFEAAKDGKVVMNMYGRRAIIRGNHLIFADTDKTVVAFVEYLDGWTIEEPPPPPPEPEPEYEDSNVVDYHDDGERWVSYKGLWSRLKDIEGWFTFAGYGYRWEEIDEDLIEKKECVLNMPFVFGDDPTDNRARSAVSGKIRWCDFVRFSCEKRRI